MDKSELITIFSALLNTVEISEDDIQQIADKVEVSYLDVVDIFETIKQQETEYLIFD